ncbi:Inner membrane protein [Rhodovulum sp. PH10]|uniref:MAPEG family protein n=1 Tax=Rhodovulum sp. PH10 TaxID=1187851 RepID=UPI00027C25F2|nr:MAPEG family protein [Rhodovulum sp. PH10]EJW13109.1 Inner membrane protein [Rhodovulum sp. PH10]
MPATPVQTELLLLAGSVVLLIVQIFLQSGLMTRELGSTWNTGPRDDGRKPTGVLAGRAERALKNLLETYPAFVGLLLALVVTGRTGGLGLLGAHLWFWARVAYVPLYLAGVPVVRSLVWTVALAGLVTMLAALLV